MLYRGDVLRLFVPMVEIPLRSSKGTGKNNVSDQAARGAIE